jgi:hypothetical protein
MGGFFALLRDERDATPMPAGADATTDYICNDCQHHGSRPFHVVGIECEVCFSFNTRRL